MSASVATGGRRLLMRGELARRLFGRADYRALARVLAQPGAPRPVPGTERFDPKAIDDWLDRLARPDVVVAPADPLAELRRRLDERTAGLAAE